MYCVCLSSFLSVCLQATLSTLARAGRRLFPRRRGSAGSTLWPETRLRAAAPEEEEGAVEGREEEGSARAPERTVGSDLSTTPTLAPPRLH